MTITLEKCGSAIKAGVGWVKKVWTKAVGVVAPVAGKVAAVAVATVVTVQVLTCTAQAQFVPVFGDPSTITAAATTAFTAIATFMIGALGFWVIYRLVKKIRG